MKKLFLLITFVFMSFFLLSTVAYATPKVILDGKELSFDVPPVLENGKTLVPLRMIFSALGAEVKWNNDTQTVTAIKGDKVIQLVVGGEAYRNEQPVELEVPAKKVSGRIMVPLRFISEALDCKVKWIEETQTIEIISADQNESDKLQTITKNTTYEEHSMSVFWLLWIDRLCDTGEFSEAVDYANEKIKLDPKNSYLYNAKGYALIAWGKPEEALTCLDTAISLNPENDAALCNMSWAYNEMGKFNEALEYSIKALNIVPLDELSLTNKGNALFGLGKYNESIDCYNEALAINSNSKFSLWGKGFANYELGYYAEASESLTKYIELDPMDIDGYYMLAQCYEEVNNYKDAIATYNRAIKIYPNDEWLYIYKGYCYYSLGKYNEAIICYDKVTQISDQNADGYYCKSLAYAKLKNTEMALKNLRLAIQYDDIYADFAIMEDAFKYLRTLDEFKNIIKRAELM